MAVKLGEDELVASITEEKFDIRKFFEFFPENIYKDLYGIGYNEFLKVATSMKETLMDEFPEKKDMIEKNCSDMLDHFQTEYDKWYKSFTGYCDRNVFRLPPNLSIYGPEMEKSEEVEEYKFLQDQLLAQAYRRKLLIQKLSSTEDEIEKRKALRDKVSRTEELVHFVRKCEVLDQRIRAAKLSELMTQN